MRNFFNLPQAGFGAKGKRWSPRIGVSTGRITRSRRSDNTEPPNALSFRNAAAGLLPAPIRLIAISPLGQAVSNTACRKARTDRPFTPHIGFDLQLSLMMA